MLSPYYELGGIASVHLSRRCRQNATVLPIVRRNIRLNKSINGPNELTDQIAFS